MNKSTLWMHITGQGRFDLAVFNVSEVAIALRENEKFESIKHILRPIIDRAQEIRGLVVFNADAGEGGFFQWVVDATHYQLTPEGESLVIKGIETPEQHLVLELVKFLMSKRCRKATVWGGSSLSTVKSSPFSGILYALLMGYNVFTLSGSHGRYFSGYESIFIDWATDYHSGWYMEKLKKEDPEMKFWKRNEIGFWEQI